MAKTNRLNGMMYPNLYSFCLSLTFDNYRSNFNSRTDVPFLRFIPWINHNRLSYGDLLKFENVFSCWFVLFKCISLFWFMWKERTFIQLYNRSMLFTTWIIFQKFSIKKKFEEFCCQLPYFSTFVLGTHTPKFFFLWIIANNCWNFDFLVGFFYIFCFAKRPFFDHIHILNAFFHN